MLNLNKLDKLLKRDNLNSKICITKHSIQNKRNRCAILGGDFLFSKPSLCCILFGSTRTAHLNYDVG